MTAKIPTPQGISALLRKAGHLRSEQAQGRTLNSGYRARAHLTQPGAVRVSYLSWSVNPSRETVQGKLSAYAEAIEAAGFTVERDDFGLVVTAKSETQEQYGVRWGTDNEVVFAFRSREEAEAAIRDDGRGIGILVVHEYEPGTPNATDWREVES